MLLISPFPDAPECETSFSWIILSPLLHLRHLLLQVAAQNCRKRKLDTIDELQTQVDQVKLAPNLVAAFPSSIEVFHNQKNMFKSALLMELGKNVNLCTSRVALLACVAPISFFCPILSHLAGSSFSHLGFVVKDSCLNYILDTGQRSRCEL